MNHTTKMALFVSPLSSMSVKTCKGLASRPSPKVHVCALIAGQRSQQQVITRVSNIIPLPSAALNREATDISAVSSQRENSINLGNRDLDVEPTDLVSTWEHRAWVGSGIGLDLAIVAVGASQLHGGEGFAEGMLAVLLAYYMAGRDCHSPRLPSVHLCLL